MALGDEGTCDSAKTSPKVEKTVRSHLRDTIRSVWTDEILREQTEEVKAFIDNKFEEMKVHFQVIFRIYIYISVPLILSFCLSLMHGQTSHRRRLKLCMWPLPMGAGDIGHMRSASAASEAVI